MVICNSCGKQISEKRIKIKDKIILTVKRLRQAIYTLRNKGYSDENICIYLTKETIIEYAKTMPTNSSVILDFAKTFESENKEKINYRTMQKAKELLNKGVFSAS